MWLYDSPDNYAHEFLICYYKYLVAEICAGCDTHMNYIFIIYVLCMLSHIWHIYVSQGIIAIAANTVLTLSPLSRQNISPQLFLLCEAVPQSTDLRAPADILNWQSTENVQQQLTGQTFDRRLLSTWWRLSSRSKQMIVLITFWCYTQSGDLFTLTYAKIVRHSLNEQILLSGALKWMQIKLQNNSYSGLPVQLHDLSNKTFQSTLFYFYRKNAKMNKKLKQVAKMTVNPEW